MNSSELFICTNIEPGMLVRLERTRKRLRQADVAQSAGVTQAEVSALERGRYVIPAVRKRIFQVLELEL